jgi:hypothetical protein
MARPPQNDLISDRLSASRDLGWRPDREGMCNRRPTLPRKRLPRASGQLLLLFGMEGIGAT